MLFFVWVSYFLFIGTHDLSWTISIKLFKVKRKKSPRFLKRCSWGFWWNKLCSRMRRGSKFVHQRSPSFLHSEFWSCASDTFACIWWRSPAGSFGQIDKVCLRFCQVRIKLKSSLISLSENTTTTYEHISMVTVWENSPWFMIVRSLLLATLGRALGLIVFFVVEQSDSESKSSSSNAGFVWSSKRFFMNSLMLVPLSTLLSHWNSSALLITASIEKDRSTIESMMCSG